MADPGEGRHYCTYFDAGFLSRGIALHASLQEHDPGSTLWVLCMDDDAHAQLSTLDLAGMRLVHLRELETADPDLLSVKESRSRVEYYFTCSPAWPLHLLEHHDLERVTYVDADLFFYSSPEPLFDEAPVASVLIHGHRFPRRLKGHEQYGIYNVGFVSFRADSTGLDCLRKWREQCLEWCNDEVLPDGRFADQGYLNDWPDRWPNVHVLQHPGCAVAPWNLDVHPVSVDENGRPAIGNDPLIFYHFHGLRRLRGAWFRTGLHQYHVHMAEGLRDHVYAPYVKLLIDIEDQRLTTHHAVRNLRGERPLPLWLESALHPLRSIKRQWYRDLQRWET